MRGELSPPALHRPWTVNAGQPAWRQILYEVRRALGELDPIIPIFVGVGLLLTVCLLIFNPSAVPVAAGLVQ